MNLTENKITESVREAIQLADKQDWVNFFDTVIKQETVKIGQLTINELTHMQGRVSIVVEMRDFFLQVHNPNPKQK